MEYVGKLAYRTTDNKLYLCQYKELIEVGDFIKAIDGVWQKVSADTEEALLVVADDDTVLSLTVRLGGVLDVPSEVVVCPQAQVNNTRRAPNIAIIPLRIRVHLLYNFIVS
jgi:hypothetical protein